MEQVEQAVHRFVGAERIRIGSANDLKIVRHGFTSRMLLTGFTGEGKSRSPSISRRSISAVRLSAVIGTSFGPPSNGFSELSPILSIVWKTQQTSTLAGIVTHT